MSFVSDKTTIQKLFNDNWTGDIAFDNIDFDAPQGEWVRLNILNGNTTNRAINYAKRVTGVVIVQIFVEKYIGTERLNELADGVVAIFQDTKQNDITFGNASFEIVGEIDGLYQGNVTVGFYRE